MNPICSGEGGAPGTIGNYQREKWAKRGERKAESLVFQQEPFKWKRGRRLQRIQGGRQGGWQGQKSSSKTIWFRKGRGEKKAYVSGGKNFQGGRYSKG